MARIKKAALDIYDFGAVADAIDSNATWYGTDVSPEISMGEYIMWINDTAWKVLIKPAGENTFFLIPCDEGDMVSTITDALDQDGEAIAQYVGQDLEELREQVEEKDPDDLVSLALTVDQYGGWFFAEEQPMSKDDLLNTIVDQLDLPKEEAVDWDQVIDEALEGLLMLDPQPGKEYREFRESIGLDPDNEAYVMEDGEFDEIMWGEDVKNMIDSMASDHDTSLLDLIGL